MPSLAQRYGMHITMLRVKIAVMAAAPPVVILFAIPSMAKIVTLAHRTVEIVCVAGSDPYNISTNVTGG
jgi:hypothetical protein